MVNTRRTNSTPVPHHNAPPPQTNDEILRELRDMVVSIDRRVQRHDDMLAAREGQNKNHIAENGPINEENPSDHQSNGDHRKGTESGGSSGSHSQPPSTSITQVWANVRKFNPPIFEGKPDPVEAVGWLKRLEKIFKVIECTSQQKVLVAEQLFLKSAQEWWDSSRLNEGADLTWEEFKEKFLQHYFPTSLRVKKETELLTFKQGDLHEDEFIARFLELSKYCSYTQKYSDPKWMCNRLVEKARSDLKTALSPFLDEITSFEKMYEKLRTIARSKREEEVEKKMEFQARSTTFMRPVGGISKKNSHSFSGMKRQFNQHSRSQSGGPSRSHFSGAPRSQFSGGQNSFRGSTALAASTANSQKCAKCGRVHPGNCLICFKCGKPGHISRFCEDGSRGANDARAAVPGRVFALS